MAALPAESFSLFKTFVSVVTCTINSRIHACLNVLQYTGQCDLKVYSRVSSHDGLKMPLETSRVSSRVGLRNSTFATTYRVPEKSRAKTAEAGGGTAGAEMLRGRPATGFAWRWQQRKRRSRCDGLRA